MSTTTIDAKAVYQKSFPKLAAQFDLKPFQEQVINNVIRHGSSLAIMPTGGGKSLIYWVAAQCLGGTSLVISPLIALIEEQAEKIRSEGLSVLAIHSGMGATEQMMQLREFAVGSKHYDFIFVSPERIATDGFFEYCISVQKAKVKLVVVDEVHCISQWGFDFRPFYTRIPFFLDDVFGKDHWPAVLGLTATINPKELAEISIDFKIPPSSILKAEVTLRLDVDLRIEKHPSEDQKKERLWQLISEHRAEKILVYVYRKYYKNGVEQFAEDARLNGYSAAHFHGDMTSGERMNVIQAFRDGGTDVVFATNAFGMGIDIPNIRVVIHFMLPESIEQYYQEIGRGGRDQLGATAYMLYSNKNIEVRKTHFIDRSFPDEEEFNTLFRRVANNEIGKKTLQYFSESELQTPLPYFISSGAVTILGKGFTTLKVFKQVTDPALKDVVSSSKTGTVIPTLNKPQFAAMSCKAFFNITYAALVNNTATLSKNLDKCLIIDARESTLTATQMSAMLQYTEIRRSYKHQLLDYLTYVFDNYDGSQSLHQEIGKYLGVNKHQLGKIHQTECGVWVRSKSEVIIANILYRSAIPFVYEQKLFYDSKHWKEPDFTITYNGKTWYWEHLGMLGDEQYDHDWIAKKVIYEKLAVTDQLILTKESAVLSGIVNNKIAQLKKGLS